MHAGHEVVMNDAETPSRARRPSSLVRLVPLTLVLSIGCTTAPRSEAATKRPRAASAASLPLDPSAAPPSARAPASLEYVERCLHASCDARLPTLVVIHGLGDSPEAFVALYDGLTVPVRVVALRAPLAWNTGFAWFPYRARASSPEEIAGALRALVPRVGATLDALCATRACEPPVVVSGFSQGGMMSYALAALAPERFVAAVPLSGMLPTGLEPITATHRPRIVAFHGASDRVVPAALDVEGTERLRAAGYSIDLLLEPEVGHTIPPATRARALGVIDAALRPASVQ